MRDLTDYMCLNKDELWEGTEGRTVTLLVLRDGDNVNLYGLLENLDGSYSPLNDSWGSFPGGRGEEGLGPPQLSEEEVKTKARMAEIMKQLKNTKTKKNKKDKRKTSVSQQASLNSSLKKFPDNGILDDTPSPRLELTEGSVRRPLATPLTTPLATPRQHSGGRRLHNTSRRGSRGSRPNTQEHSEFLHSSLSKSTLRELPNANPPIPVDFTRRKPLEGIRPQGNRLSAVDENRGKDSPLQLPETPNTQVKNKNYDSYRKSIVTHGIVRDSDTTTNTTSTSTTTTTNISETVRESHEAWPRRDPSKPFYRLPDTITNSNRYDRDRLNRSHNPELLRSIQQSTMNRPKTSPEVLEHRPNTTGNRSTVSERIQLRDPDERLRRLCSILGSPGNSQSHRHTDSPTHDNISSIPQPLSLSSSLSGSNTLRRRTNSVSVSLASLRSRGGTPPSPGHGALVTSGSREQRDALRDLMRSQGAISRHTTPDQPPLSTRRPPSGRVQMGSTHLPPVTPQRRTPRRRPRPRCGHCSRRLSVATTYECRCGGIFCAQHRYAETHTCSFDYRTAGRTIIAMANPYVAPNKLPKI
ncbi:hypothetical protein Pcinc_031540 [Petrolisthes cinctipes]|uniref:AN1-type domain-containing protein n=1 Tax=Petrolisthes cinctipes TaxID=88211 RepID=A0AAE1K4D7_PETCI|nr:hypothetical protein Pcinc_031540 [Petrolisthes cinctipes]